MRTIALVAALMAGSLVYAQGTPDKPKATPTHFDFDDDVVDAGVDRPTGDAVDALRHRARESLIHVRQNFLPEMLRTSEGS